MKDEGEVQVVVTDVKIPFWSMVALLVKLTIAAIPAYIILIVVGFLAVATLVGIGAAIDPTLLEWGAK